MKQHSFEKKKEFCDHCFLPSSTPIHHKAFKDIICLFFYQASFTEDLLNQKIKNLENTEIRRHRGDLDCISATTCTIQVSIFKNPSRLKNSVAEVGGVACFHHITVITSASVAEIC